MRLLRLHLKAFGPFTDRVLELGPQGQRLVLVHGPNEAGKSSALRALTDLRFGIPMQSADNFVHAHPDMRVGGVFVDGRGREHSLLRRKGRGATLLLADFANAEASAGEAAPPELEALLTGGLSREEYEDGFAIDHERLRLGGRDLLDGKGEIGAALFEASAGVRSIPQVLERLDQAARRFFMPGARGKNARINEALRAWEEHHGAYKEALVRPARWAELFRRHQQAAEEVATLEARRVELNGRRLLTQELRAVAPLLGALDHAARLLDELRAAPLLSPTAATERAAAQAELARAKQDAELAAAAADRQRERLGGLVVDEAILDLGAAVRRLSASGEAIDRHRGDLATAAADVESEAERVAALAARIDPGAPTETVLARALAPAERADLDERLRRVEQASQALEQHRESLAREAAEHEGADTIALPPQDARLALGIAREEISRHDRVLRRLAELPAEIKAARRALAAGLADAGLPDEAALPRPRPLLDAQLDEAIDAQRRSATRREEREKRLDQIERALAEEVEQRDRVLAQGAVPTADDVRAARGRRDAGWALVRGTYIDATNPPIEDFAAGRPLPLAFEEAVAEADRLADALAADHERAAQLQAITRAIADLGRDRDELARQLAAIAREDDERESRWHRMLADAGLPALSPAALRDWQSRLAALRAAAEGLQARIDELDDAQAVAASLATALRAAIAATGLASPSVDSALDTLQATAAGVEESIRRRETELATAAGKREQRERQRQQMAALGEKLAAALRDARAALAPALAGLGLPGDAATAVIRARLAEFDGLLAAADELALARSAERRARQALSLLEQDACTIAGRLGDPEPADLRLYVERLAARLAAAESTARESELARQALDSALESRRRSDEAAARAEAALAALCGAAGVESAGQLPAAEERSERRRQARAEFDRASRQLAEASRRSVDELRALLAGQDAARLDADESACAQAQAQVDDELRAARQREESARHELQAIDGADTAAAAREAMERAAARVRAAMPAWIRSRLAHSLLDEALRRFRERAQAPMLGSASRHFERMTGGQFVRLASDDTDGKPVLIAERRDGARLRVEAMSEGTRDQLYLALRLAALEMRRASGIDLPLVLDDVLMTSDDDRAVRMLEALADFATGGQVVVFTHHAHLAELAARSLPGDALAVVQLSPAAGDQQQS